MQQLLLCSFLRISDYLKGTSSVPEGLLVDCAVSLADGWPMGSPVGLHIGLPLGSPVGCPEGAEGVCVG